MSYAHILLDQQTPIATLTLNRPDKRNALSADMMREITHALRAVCDSDARGLILAAHGPVFSAGHSFADMAGQDLDHLRALIASRSAPSKVKNACVSKSLRSRGSSRIPQKRCVPHSAS